MIIDANVALLWVLAEPGSDLAERFIAGSRLQSPSVFKLEVAHALTKARRTKRLSTAEMREAFDVLAEIAVVFTPFEDLLPEAVTTALALHVTTYDALYLALVAASGEQLVTADLRLRNAAARDARFAGRVLLLAEVGG